MNNSLKTLVLFASIFTVVSAASAQKGLSPGKEGEAMFKRVQDCRQQNSTLNCLQKEALRIPSTVDQKTEMKQRNQAIKQNMRDHGTPYFKPGKVGKGS